MGKVLVVDDTQFMRMKISKIIKEIGHEVVEADNGKNAILKYQEEKPDLVLMDITMPEMDGITSVKELKKIDDNVNIVMVSAMGQQQLVIEAIKSGARDFILKPFHNERLVNVISKFLKDK